MCVSVDTLQSASSEIESHTRNKTDDRNEVETHDHGWFRFGFNVQALIDETESN